MEQGHPITVFMVTALALWAIYLYHQNRLGVIGGPGKTPWAITPSRVIKGLPVARVVPAGPAWPPAVPISPAPGSVLAPPVFTGPATEPPFGGAPTPDEILGGY